MMQAIQSIGKFMIPALAVAALSGCVNFGTKAPPALLVLTADNIVDNGKVNGGTRQDALVIMLPETPRKLNTNRIPVQTSDSSIAYLKDAVWSDKPAALWQQLLSEVIASKNNRFILSPANSSGQEKEQISGNLINFGVDASANEVVITFDAIKIVDGQQVQKKRFVTRESIAVIEYSAAAKALNIAANRLAGEVADWVK